MQYKTHFTNAHSGQLTFCNTKSHRVQPAQVHLVSRQNFHHQQLREVLISTEESCKQRSYSFKKNSRVPYHFLSVSRLTSSDIMNNLGGEGGEEKNDGLQSQK